jgi:TetR/AcrR family transcriptional regulator, acrAB operon repressor
MRKTKQDTEISKLRILLAAEEEFCRRGFTAANMDAIARVVGMTKGAIFWHYKSKSDLFKAVMKRAVERVKTIFQEAFSAENLNVVEKCRGVIKQVGKDKAFDVFMVLSEAGNAGGFPQDVLDEFTKEISEIFRDALKVLEEAKSRGELKPDTDVRDILAALALFMSGFAKFKEQKSLFAPISGHIGSDSVVDVIFVGLASFQKNNK